MGKKLVKGLALLCAGIMAMGVLTGCSGEKDSGKDDTTKQKEPQNKEEHQDEDGVMDEKTETGKEENEVKKEEGKYPKIEIETELECHDYWEDFIKAIEEKYSTDNKGEIIFYGASNFARWENMEEDMSGYKVQNHAFGGSIDAELVGYDDRILFPYEPKIVFFQTGSNDYVQLSGTDEEKVEKCMEYKKQMFAAFHEQMPDAKFVIMSSLLLPGRAEYLNLTLTINERLQKLAEEADYLYYVDANALIYDGTNFDESLFVEDMIHLNHDGQLRWYNGYIKPMIEQVITENGMESVRK